MQNSNQNIPKLEAKHLVWIVDAALNTFINQLEECEMDVARHTLFATTPLAGRFKTVNNREELIEQSKKFIEEYNLIITHLQLMREKAGDASVRASFNFKK